MKTYLYACVFVLFSSLGVFASQDSEQNSVCPVGYYLNNNVCIYDAELLCPADLILTQYGCLEKGPCPEDYGFYNLNMCIPSKNLHNQHGYVNPYTQYYNPYSQYYFGINPYGFYGIYSNGYPQ